MDVLAYLVIGLASNAGTALTTMPQPYEYNQCQKIADEYKWPWKATCVRAQSVYKETGCVGTFYSKGYVELRPVECIPTSSVKALYTKTEIINELDKFDVLPGACYSQMLDRLFPCKGSMTK